jgi:hypothetical protein
MSFKSTFAKPLPHIIWLVLSIIILVAAWATDPYVFGFAAFGSAAISGAMAVLGLVFGVRTFVWSVIAAVPTALSFALLSTYNWA